MALESRAYPRISAYYILFYATVAVWSPYFALWLRSRGLHPASIGWVLAVYPAVALVGQPFWGVINDRLKREWWTVLTAIVMAPLAANLFRVAPVALFPAVAAAMAFFQTAIIPVADSMTVGILGSHRYGEARLFGSLGYALIVALAGFLYHRFGVGHFIDFYLLASILALAGILIYPRPPRQIAADRPPWFRGIGDLWRQPRFRGVLLFVLFITMSQAINGSYFALYYRAMHHPLSWLGILFGLGALSEIPVFYLAGRLIQRFGPTRTLFLSGAIFAFRWIVTALGPPTWGLILLQLLHGPSFGLGLASGVALAASASATHNRVSAQSLYSATSTGLAPLLGSIVGGYLLGWMGPQNLYWCDAFICLVGVAGIARLALKPTVQSSERRFAG